MQSFIMLFIMLYITIRYCNSNRLIYLFSKFEEERSLLSFIYSSHSFISGRNIYENYFADTFNHKYDLLHFNAHLFRGACKQQNISGRRDAVPMRVR